MAAGTFQGGMHPYDGKELSMDRHTSVLLPKKELVFPVSQHIGAPAVPVVSVSDTVLAGQKLAQATGYVSSCVISSVSGTVKAVEPRLTAAGGKVLSVVVENDGEYRMAQGIGEPRDVSRLSKEEIRKIIQEAGIVGMGGAGFPTHVKLTPKEDTAIDYVIVNGSECEPYLTSDYRMMLEEPKRLIAGLKIVLKLFERAEGIIAVEDNKPEAIAKVKEAIGTDSRISVRQLKTKYPQGSERQLIYAVTGRKINSSMLPSDAGCIVNNVDTILSVGLAVAESTPLMRRVVTVTGSAIKEPGNFIVKTGSSYQELLEAAGGFCAPVGKMISGGPMMGQALYSLDIPVTKVSSALLVLTQEEAQQLEPGACIRCGRCVSVCPGRIVPQKLMEYAQRFDTNGFEKIDGMECCECGCCTYVCPAGRKLTQSFKQMRRQVQEERRKK